VDSDQQAELEIKLKEAQRAKQQDFICLICLCEEEEGDELITPCKCTGSVKYIHVSCLGEWLEGKKHQKETEGVNSYIWKGLECEICKALYQDTVRLRNGKEFCVLRYQIHEEAKSYMIIESITNTTSKTIHVVNFTNQRKIRVVKNSH